MPEKSVGRSLTKRVLIVVAGLLAFTLLFVIACRIAVQQMFVGIESSRATGLAAVSWDTRSMWSSNGSFDKSYISKEDGSWISRSAELRSRSSSFDNSVQTLHQIVASRHGYFEDLRTESRSGHGRVLAAALSVPSADFDGTVSDLKAIGRVEDISVAGEDSAVKIESAARHLTATETNLSRLQKLQRERRGELRDAVALEKDIAQANENAAEARRQHENLLSTVAQSHIRFTLLEDYRVPLQANLRGSFLQVRNSLIEGVGSIFSSTSLCVAVLFEYGLPFLFWAALLFWPSRAVWRHFRRTQTHSPAVA